MAIVAKTPEAKAQESQEAKPANPAKFASHRDPQIKGQVAMHAIIAGYRVGAILAATLGSTPDKIREELHKIANEVADKIEARTFRD